VRCRPVSQTVAHAATSVLAHQEGLITTGRVFRGWVFRCKHGKSQSEKIELLVFQQLANLPNVLVDRFSFAIRQYLWRHNQDAGVDKEKGSALIGAIQSCTQDHGKDS
jgi:hypothetical protein